MDLVSLIPYLNPSCLWLYAAFPNTAAGQPLGLIILV